MLPSVSQKDAKAPQQGIPQAGPGQHRSHPSDPRGKEVQDVVQPRARPSEVPIALVLVAHHGVQGAHGLEGPDAQHRRDAPPGNIPQGRKEEHGEDPIHGVLRHRLHGGTHHAGLVQNIRVASDDARQRRPGRVEVAPEERRSDREGLVLQGAPRERRVEQIDLHREKSPVSNGGPQQEQADGRGRRGQYGGTEKNAAPSPLPPLPFSGVEARLPEMDDVSYSGDGVGQSSRVAQQNVQQQSRAQDEDKIHIRHSPNVNPRICNFLVLYDRYGGFAPPNASASRGEPSGSRSLRLRTVSLETAASRQDFSSKKASWGSTGRLHGFSVSLYYTIGGTDRMKRGRDRMKLNRKRFSEYGERKDKGS